MAAETTTPVYTVVKKADAEALLRGEKRKASEAAADASAEKKADKNDADEYAFNWRVGGGVPAKDFFDRIPFSKPKSARAPQSGINVNIGGFNEPVFVTLDDCGTLDEQPIQISEKFGSATMQMTIESDLVAELRVLSNLMRDRCCTANVEILLDFSDEERKKPTLIHKWPPIVDSTRHISMQMPKHNSAPDERDFVIQSEDGEILDPDNAVLMFRPVRRLVFRLSYVGFRSKTDAPSLYKPLVHLEVGPQDAAKVEAYIAANGGTPAKRTGVKSTAFDFSRKK